MYLVVHTLHFLLSQICGGLCQTRKTPTLDSSIVLMLSPVKEWSDGRAKVF
jgi:hypothetical protein